MFYKIEKRFTGFDLKLIALILMFLDHIHYIFEFTGKVPILFSQLGRLSGGLFLFTMVEGYYHTSNKKKYFTRIYIMSVFMAIVKYFIQYKGNLIRPDGFYPINGIFQTFAILIVMFKGIDLIREGKKAKGTGLFFLPYLASLTSALILSIIPIHIGEKLFNFITIFLPSPFMVEGGLYVIIGALILYIFRENRKKQALYFFVFEVAWMIILPIKFIENISLRSMFTDYYEWMGAFAIIFMLMYNEEKGRSMKKLFYIFYPAHIYILYLISYIFYNSLV